MTLSTQDYLSRDAMGLAALVQSGEVAAEAVLTAAMGRISALNPAINAVVETLYDTIENQLAALDRNAPFAGVPYLIKDLHTLVRGSALTQASRFLAGHRSSHDSDLVARLRKAGFILLGRTNSPEFGLNATTEPRLFGATRNPWDLSRSPGGSSGGAAAAVASGMVPAAHATDSGGSTRIPAAACGLVGLKPSRGRNFAGLDTGEGWSDLFNAHAVTRSVRDCAAILDATWNREAPAPYRAPDLPPLLDVRASPPKALRIGVMAKPPSGVPVDAAYLTALDDVVSLLRDLGHTVTPFRYALDGAAYARAFTLILSSSVAATVSAHEEATGRRAEPEDFEPAVWSAIMLARSTSSDQLNRAVAELHLQAGGVVSQMRDLDLLLTPTLARPAPLLGELSTDAEDFGDFLARVFSFAPFTSIWNGAGLPAISLPLAWTDGNLPLGFQFVAHYGREDILLSLAAALERQRPWKSKQDALLARLG
jgi:Asp-tRNA(Asn)/Glu-tRNA(Gln) amidotransferase A subunit family amidase